MDMPINIELALANRIVPALNANSFLDLMWWTKDSLYEWANEAIYRMSRMASGGVDTTPLFMTPNNGDYDLPLDTLSILHVSANSRSLRPSNVRDLEALLPTWRNVEAVTITHYVRQDQGLFRIRIYPKPINADVAGMLRVTRHYLPVTVSESATVLNWPEVLTGYVALRVIESARTADTEAKMPESAAVAGQIADVFEQLARKYWGEVQ